jgi:adenosylcobinamide-GDP ribazoletransferase
MPEPVPGPAWKAGARLSLTTLTVLPVRGPASVDRRAAGVAMAGAPLVGLLLGLLAGGVLEGTRAVTDGGELLACALAVAALAALTRGLHLDGLADTVDGLASYLPPEQARAVMKKPDLGPLGLAAVVLDLLVQTAALLACVAAGRGLLALVLAAVTGRVAVTLACTRVTPAASPGGLGAAVAGTVPRPA